MKRVSLLLVVCILIYCLSACAVSIPRAKPTSGVWYCEELKIAIDLDLRATGEARCARLYDENGDYEELWCFFDYGSALYLSREEAGPRLLIADYKFRDDVFVLISREDKTKYYFYESDA